MVSYICNIYNNIYNLYIGYTIIHHHPLEILFLYGIFYYTKFYVHTLLNVLYAIGGTIYLGRPSARTAVKNILDLKKILEYNYRNTSTRGGHCYARMRYCRVREEVKGKGIVCEMLRARPEESNPWTNDMGRRRG